MSVVLSDSEDGAPVFRWPPGLPRPGSSAGEVIVPLPLPASNDNARECYGNRGRRDGHRP